MGPGEIGSGNDPGVLGQFVKGFLGAFEGVAVRRLGVHDEIHFAGNLENEIGAPLNLFGGARKREAKSADLISSHGNHPDQSFGPAEAEREDSMCGEAVDE